MKNAFEIQVLLGLPGITTKNIKKLLDFHPITSPMSNESDFQKLISFIENKKTSRITKSDITHAMLLAEDSLKESERLGFEIYTFQDDNFPTNLFVMSDDVPVILFVKGRPELVKHNKMMNRNNVGVVGNRVIDDSVSQRSKQIVSSLTEAGLCIVSGLGDGSEKLALETCIEAQGTTTIGIMADGLDQIYSEKYAAISERILEHNGILVSEYPIGAFANKAHYSRRSQLIAGFSKAVVLLESSLSGSASVAVNAAISQNKIVACVDYSDEQVKTSNKLNHELIESMKGNPLTPYNRDKYAMALKEDKSDSIRYNAHFTSSHEIHALRKEYLMAVREKISNIENIEKSNKLILKFEKNEREIHELIGFIRSFEFFNRYIRNDYLSLAEAAHGKAVEYNESIRQFLNDNREIIQMIKQL